MRLNRVHTVHSTRVSDTFTYVIYWTMDILQFNLFNKINNYIQLQETDCSMKLISKNQKIRRESHKFYEFIFLSQHSRWSRMV